MLLIAVNLAILWIIVVWLWWRTMNINADLDYLYRREHISRFGYVDGEVRCEDTPRIGDLPDEQTSSKSGTPP